MIPDSKPLRGKTVLVTRSRAQASELSLKIEQYGGKALEFPLIQIVPPRDSFPLEQAIKNIEQFDWILFTSVNGVQFFAEQMKQNQVDFSTAKVGVVGPRTAEMLRKFGKDPDLVAEDFKAEGLLAALEGVLQKGDAILLPRANIARDLLPMELKARGMKVTEVEAYETVITEEGAQEVINNLKSGGIDVITFTSSSTVKNFCKVLRNERMDVLLAGVKVACIGPITAQTAESLGLKIDRIANEYTIDGLVTALTELHG